MSHTPKKWSIKARVFAASLTVVFAACGKFGGIAERQQRAARSTAARRTGDAATRGAAAFDGRATRRPVTPPLRRRSRTSGNMKKITAIDALTVEFQLCSPDAAFLSEGRVQRRSASRTPTTSTAHAPGRARSSTPPNGTGPYMLKRMETRATGSSVEANPDYWGDKAPRPRTSSSAGATRPAQRLLELQVRHRRRHRQPRHRPTSPRSRATANLKFYPRDGPEHVLPRLQQHDRSRGTTRRVRQAHRHWASTASGSSSNFYPDGSTVADYFTPCDDRRSAARATRLVRLRRGGGQDSS